MLISSIATRQLNPKGAPYNMAKAAIEALAVTLAKEEKRHGIRVNVIAPVQVATDMGDRLAKATVGAQPRSRSTALQVSVEWSARRTWPTPSPISFRTERR